MGTGSYAKPLARPRRMLGGHQTRRRYRTADMHGRYVKYYSDNQTRRHPPLHAKPCDRKYEGRGGENQLFYKICGGHLHTPIDGDWKELDKQTLQKNEIDPEEERDEQAKDLCKEGRREAVSRYKRNLDRIGGIIANVVSRYLIEADKKRDANTAAHKHSKERIAGEVTDCKDERPLQERLEQRNEKRRVTIQKQKEKTKPPKGSPRISDISHLRYCLQGKEDVLEDVKNERLQPARWPDPYIPKFTTSKGEEETKEILETREREKQDFANWQREQSKRAKQGREREPGEHRKRTMEETKEYQVIGRPTHEERKMLKKKMTRIEEWLEGHEPETDEQTQLTQTEKMEGEDYIGKAMDEKREEEQGEMDTRLQTGEGSSERSRGEKEERGTQSLQETMQSEEVKQTGGRRREKLRERRKKQFDKTRS